MRSPRRQTVRVPASSANLGPGFDALGLALGFHLDLTFDTSVHTTPADLGADDHTDEHHLAVRAFRAEGGQGPVAVHADFAGGRGLGFSGAARVAGALAARLQHGDTWVAARDHALHTAAGAEGHGDNATASVLGGFTVYADGLARRIPNALDARVVVWIPDAETSTKASRGKLPDSVALGDAAVSIAHTALLVTAITTGDTAALRVACDDVLHQPGRLARAPHSAAALRAFLDGPAWCAWLSGSGPTVAALCAPDATAACVHALPDGGRAVVTTIDTEGARIL